MWISYHLHVVGKHWHEVLFLTDFSLGRWLCGYYGVLCMVGPDYLVILDWLDMVCGWPGTQNWVSYLVATDGTISAQFFSFWWTSWDMFWYNITYMYFSHVVSVLTQQTLVVWNIKAEPLSTTSIPQSQGGTCQKWLYAPLKYMFKGYIWKLPTVWWNT